MDLQKPLYFLRMLKGNNVRDWFNANKDSYLKEHEQINVYYPILYL